MDRKVVLVTGATRGIGRAVVEGVARAGHIAVLGARNLERGRTVAQELTGDVYPIELDVTDEQSIHEVAGRISTEFGRIDSLVNNAGINVGYENPPSQTSLDDMRAVYATDVFGVVSVTSALIPLLRQSPSPRIVNVSSVRGSLGSRFSWVGPWSMAYGTAKSALNAVSAHYAHELGRHGFAVTAVSPGHVATDLTHGGAPLSPAQGAAEIVRLALAKSLEANGVFLDENGLSVPW
jgi:NAD(P)-dependent dehydrogenase (short-subunit alcohol dehydrogenase family)